MSDNFNGLLSEEESDEMVKEFSVEKTMREVKDHYIEDHDRVIAEIHAKIENKGSEE